MVSNANGNVIAMKIKNILKKLAYGPLCGVFSSAYKLIASAEYAYYTLRWKAEGAQLPAQQDAELMRENVTFIYKSFERQKQAKKLYRSIQSYYPGVKVIIADDSKTPLDLQDEHLEVIHLPFNSGLSCGLNRALEKVTTPYVVRMDDDELLTPHTCFEKHLRFLMKHPEADLVGVLLFSPPKCKPLFELAKEFYAQPMNTALRKLKIPHMTYIDDGYIVVGKAPNTFVARTEKIREVGYDNHIRMIDHHDFFYRAAGRLVSVIAEKSCVFHDHNRFNRAYRRFRTDVEGDRRYIAQRNYIEMMQYMAQRRQSEKNDHQDHSQPGRKEQ